jgi:steroid delta-isomerase-like uncharacterized protein
MSSEQNKAVVRRVLEQAWSQGDMAVLDELIADQYVSHSAPPGSAPGREGVRQYVTLFRSAFPDLHASVDDVIAEGDLVVTRWTSSGTHQGELMGIPATGKRVTFSGITINRVSGGKVVEDWTNFDQLN